MLKRIERRVEGDNLACEICEICSEAMEGDI
jgi:hypothetical protein